MKLESGSENYCLTVVRHDIDTTPEMFGLPARQKSIVTSDGERWYHSSMLADFRDEIERLRAKEDEWAKRAIEYAKDYVRTHSAKSRKRR